jgi:hypothetical protein
MQLQTFFFMKTQVLYVLINSNSSETTEYSFPFTRILKVSLRLTEDFKVISNAAENVLETPHNPIYVLRTKPMRKMKVHFRLSL